MMMVALVRLGMRGTVYHPHRSRNDSIRGPWKCSQRLKAGHVFCRLPRRLEQAHPRAVSRRQMTIRQIAEHFCPVVTLAIVNLLRDQFQGLVFRAGSTAVRAGVAQLVEHLICNQTVGGSSPFASSRVSFRR
jgi:hypothetical protein